MELTEKQHDYLVSRGTGSCSSDIEGSLPVLGQAPLDLVLWIVNPGSLGYPSQVESTGACFVRLCSDSLLQEPTRPSSYPFRVCERVGQGSSDSVINLRTQRQLTWLEQVDKIQETFGLNVTQLAEILGITRQLLYRWRTDSIAEPNQSNIQRIEKTFNVIRLLSGQVKAQAKWLGKFANRRVLKGKTVLEALQHDELSPNDVEAMIGQLESSIDRLENRSKISRVEDTTVLDDLTPHA